MPRGGPAINHLDFADDIIIFCKVEHVTMKMVADTLEKYKAISGHQINKEKRFHLYAS